LLVHGTAEQVQRYLPAIARGEEAWCQLFSEPSAGSDLAGLATRATPDGDGWVVTGQKVWSSSGDVAQRGLLLARTDTSVPKHEGITYFALDMDQPGIHSRPLRQMNGNASFSEVFIDGAWVGRDDVIGGVGKGWSVAQTTLAQERIAVATRTARGAIAVASGRTAGQLDRRIADVMAETAEQAAITGYAVPEKIMLGLARDRGLATDPIMRQRLARYHTANRLNRLTMQRFQAARGAGPGAEGSILKLLLVEICTTSRDLVFDILGAEATLDGPDAPMQGQIHRAALGSPGSRIGGGTDEVQRNVIGERALGLPREPQVDRGVPYRDLRVGTVARSAERDAG
jgi:alkylation response protein AidB-like acyl-CoA dehydrogenase